MVNGVMMFRMERNKMSNIKLTVSIYCVECNERLKKGSGTMSLTFYCPKCKFKICISELKIELDD